MILPDSKALNEYRLSQAQLKDIQSDCLADDVAIDFERMSTWTEAEARTYFESGGTSATLPPVAPDCRKQTMMALGACLPNAPVPDVPLVDVSDAGTSSEHAAGHVTAPVEADAARIFCVSDLHTDHEQNLEWCRSLLKGGSFMRDALIVCGDVSASLVILEETLTTLKSAFAEVFYVTGNHDLWTKGRGLAGGLHIRKKDVDSLEKLSEIHGLCKRLGVRTEPGYACGAILAPIYSWYHSRFDTEPELDGWDGIPPVEQMMMDYFLCVWPKPLITPPAEDGCESLSKRFDQMNDEYKDADGLKVVTLKSKIDALRAKHPSAPLITFSHFVPKIDLTPEKRYLFWANLAKATGSIYLGKRIDELQPTCHCFGHTHFGWDMVLDGVRYLQAPLSYPDERQGRLGTVAVGKAAASRVFPEEESPLLVYDASTRTYPPKYDAGWSNFYAKYPRQPHMNMLVAPYVASGGVCKQVKGVGLIGWLAEGDNMSGEPDGDPTPAWAMGPISAVEFEKRQRLPGGRNYKESGGKTDWNHRTGVSVPK